MICMCKTEKVIILYCILVLDKFNKTNIIILDIKTETIIQYISKMIKIIFYKYNDIKLFIFNKLYIR